MRPEQWLYRIPLLLRSLFHRREVEQELDEEIRFHIERQIELNAAAGMTPEEARRAAHAAFGNADARREECHDHWVVAAFDHFHRDVRHAVRRLRREPVFALGVVLLLALGIGANVAVFSIIDGVLLEPLDYAEPDRLVVVRERVPEQDQSNRAVNALHFNQWKQCDCFEDIALSEYVQSLTLAGEGDPIRVYGVRMTANAFSVLGVDAQLGRTFIAADAEPDQSNNVVISDRLWRNRFGADPAIIGTTVTLDALGYTIVGVLPPGFRYHPAGNVDIDAFAPWPFEIPPWWGWTNNYSYAAVGRLADGLSLAAAGAELDAIQTAIAQEHFLGDAASLSLRAELVPMHDWVTTRSRAGLYLLFAAVGAALLVACLNVANLMLVRATARSREAGIRSALGATRLAIFRSVFIEAALLSVAGTAIGVAIAWLAVRIFRNLAGAGLPWLAEMELDQTALLAAAALSVVAALAFGLLPAIRLTRVDPERALEAGGRSSTPQASSMRGRQALVSAEVGLSVALMIVAGLLLVSYVRVNAVERGYDSTNVLTAEISLPASRYGEQQAALNFWSSLRETLAAAPGVQAVGFTSVLPLRGNYWGSTAIREGENPPASEQPRVQYRFVSEGYLRAIGLPLLRGRALTAEDYSRNSAVISQATAQLLWGEEDPLGRRFHWNAADYLFDVVGVVPDVHSQSLEIEPIPIVYRPLTGLDNGSSVLTYAAVALRMSGDPDSGAALLRAAVAGLDAELAVANVQTLRQIETAAVGARRIQLFLVGAFGFASLLIAALGIYSVLAYTVSARRHELALRMALGADHAAVLSLVLRQGMMPVLVGIAFGLAAAIALGRLLASLLFEVTPTDVATLVTVVAVTLIAAFLASLLPARRAADTPLLTSLRYE